jgi:hypothetical protein
MQMACDVRPGLTLGRIVFLSRAPRDARRDAETDLNAP